MVKDLVWWFSPADSAEGQTEQGDYTSNGLGLQSNYKANVKILVKPCFRRKCKKRAGNITKG